MAKSYVIYYDFEMGHEYRGYIYSNGKDDNPNNFMEVCEEDGATAENAFHFKSKKDANNFIKVFCDKEYKNCYEVVEV